MSDSIRFYYRGEVHVVADAPSTRTILQHLREELYCVGTKEGCAEGDCGACMVVIGELQEGEVAFKSINSCIQFLPTLDGKALFSIEDLKQADGALHPVQQAMVDCHGSQCGFCTPGFVMSLWDLYLRHEGDTNAPTRTAIDEALSGNLCRCTGYRPIIDAAKRMFELPAVVLDRNMLKKRLIELQRDQMFVYSDGNRHFHAPRTMEELTAVCDHYPDAQILSGSTDVGLWVTKQLQYLGDIVHVGRVAELKRIREIDGRLEIGAAVSLNDAYREVCRHYPELSEFRQRFASHPIRNAGTLGGNLANGSPIGDSMPWLIALGSEIAVRGSAGQRRMPLENFYLGYRMKDLRTGEFVESVCIPLPLPEQQFRTYKLSKRFDQDISAVCAAFALTFDGRQVRAARIAYGGMAATPKRATLAETALIGQPWDEVTLSSAITALTQDYAPLSDMRASGTYRMKAAQNLLRRFWLETRFDAPLSNDAVNVYADSLSGSDQP